MNCYRFQHMPYRDTVWAMLKRWNSTAFLAAGGLFILPAFASGVEAATGTGINVPPAVIFLFLLVVFVGLLGLYPGIAKRDSTVALGGVCLLGATVAILITTLGVFTLPIGLNLGKSTAMASIVAVAAGSVLTVTTFGVASLRTGAHPRSVGGFLLAMAASISFMIVAILVFGHSTPAWVSPVVNGLVAVSSGIIGSVLRTEDILSESPDPTGDVTAS